MSDPKRKEVQNIPALMAPFRARIDALDDQIIDLLATRIGIIHEVARFKEENDIPAVLPDRVLEVIDRNTANGKSKKLDSDFIQDLYKKIVSHCCAIEDSHLKKGNHNEWVRTHLYFNGSSYSFLYVHRRYDGRPIRHDDCLFICRWHKFICVLEF